MRYIQKIEELQKKYYKQAEGRYEFDPSQVSDRTATFYLHKDKQGFAMEIAVEDREKLETLLKRNKIDYTVVAGNVLPF
jgi:hypothetical protein